MLSGQSVLSVCLDFFIFISISIHCHFSFRFFFCCKYTFHSNAEQSSGSMDGNVYSCYSEFTKNFNSNYISSVYNIYGVSGSISNEFEKRFTISVKVISVVMFRMVLKWWTSISCGNRVKILFNMKFNIFAWRNFFFVGFLFYQWKKGSVRSIRTWNESYNVFSMSTNFTSDLKNWQISKVSVSVWISIDYHLLRSYCSWNRRSFDRLANANKQTNKWSE